MLYESLHKWPPDKHSTTSVEDARKMKDYSDIDTKRSARKLRDNNYSCQASIAKSISEGRVAKGSDPGFTVTRGQDQEKSEKEECFAPKCLRGRRN